MKRQRLHRRYVYSGTVRGDVLELGRGAFIRTTNKAGDVVGDMHDKTKMLWVNLGDFLIVADADIRSDAIACVEIVGMTSATRVQLRVRCGELASGAVFVMLAAKAKQQRSTSARRAA